MSDMVKRFEPIMIDIYLPVHIRSHMRTLGHTHGDTEAKVKEIMSDPQKKDEYLKLIQKLTEEEQK